MVEINELFEDAITRCGELTDVADEAMGAVDEMAEQARDAAERVFEEGAEARQHLRDLAASLESAEASLEAARRDAGGSLERLGDGAADLQAESGRLLASAENAASRLQELGTRVGESLTAQAAAVQGDFASLVEKTQEVQGEVERRLEQASEAVAAFHEALDAARAELDAKRDGWASTLERLEEAAQERAEAWVAGLQALLARQATAMVEAANVMVDRHNDAMEVVKEELARQAPQELASALEPLEASLRGLAQVAATEEQALARHASDLQTAIGDQVPVLEGLRSVLDATAQLG